MADGADNDQEKRLPATERRLERAREEGHVPRSRGLTTVMILAAAAILFWLAGPRIVADAGGLLADSLHFGHDEAFRPAAMQRHVSRAVLHALVLLLPIGLALAASAVAAPLLLGGWVFTTKPLAPDFGRLAPGNGLRNMLSVNALIELGKVLLQAAAVAAVIAVYVSLNASEFAALTGAAGTSGFTLMGRLVLVSFGLVVAALSLGTAVDVMATLWRYHRDLRMSVQEIRQEQRESEGDPQLRARIRNQQRSMARRRMMQEVPKADVVITNPTRYAVALRYEEGRHAAPRLVAAGMHAVAKRIREIAVESAVPVVEAPPLARALYAHGELGREIPASLYTAVARVLAFVFNLRREAGTVSGEPYSIDGIELPEGLDPEAGAPA